jgi:serine/threonine-protein kinase SRPK3
MNGTDLKKAALNQAKKVATTAAQAASSNGQKKRRKGDNLKPIITTDGQAGANASPETASANPAG